MTRPRGTGSIFKQPGCDRWYIKFYRNGKRVREAVGSSDYRAAQQLLTRRLAQCESGEAVDIARRKAATIEELWEGLERHYRIQERKSAECLGRRWKHLGPFFAEMRAGALTYDLLEQYVDERLSEGAKNSTINRELAALKTAFRLGRKKQRVGQVPDFPSMAENNTRTGFVEDNDYAKLTAHCSELWLRLFLEIAYSYGWRKSEILGLRLGNVNLSERTIRLDSGSTKNLEGREVTMTQRIVAMVEQATEGKAKDDYLLTRDRGHRVKDFRGAWKNLTAAAGIPDLIVHDLRRSGARQLRRAGVPESVIMAMGGWKTASVFRRYAIVSGQDQKSAVAQLEQRRAENGHNFGHNSVESIPSTGGKVQ